MAYSQKYCLVQMIDPVNLGYEFDSSDWPLHCTIADVFALDLTATRHKEFADMIVSQKPFRSAVTDITRLGPDKSIKVRRLEMTDGLYMLHETAVTFIERSGGTFNEPHFLRKDFLPHVTMRADKPHEGQIVSFSELVLIDMFPNADHTRRRVIASLPLATNQAL